MRYEHEVVIQNKLGLHARPAALFVQIANKYDSSIWVTKGEETVNGKSIMGILMLEANQGSTVLLTAEGDDAGEMIEELSQLLLDEIDVEEKT
ncbi:MAG: HPr family phosphocarrier protein [Candidatus Omnitrophota bacterium]